VVQAVAGNHGAWPPGYPFLGLRASPTRRSTVRGPRSSIAFAAPGSSSVAASAGPRPRAKMTVMTDAKRQAVADCGAREMEAVRIERLREDARRPMAANLAEAIKLSHKLLKLARAPRR